MIRFIVYLILLICSSFFSNITAQNNKPCSSNAYHQFDFWLGNWNVYDSNNKLIGTNYIKKLNNACAIQENWNSKTSGNKGTSYNYYNYSDNTWNQLWIDNTGFSLELKGSFKNNAMTLKSKLIHSKKGDYYNIVTWTKNNNNTVTQIWNYTNKSGKIIKQVFKGIYKRKEL